MKKSAFDSIKQDGVDRVSAREASVINRALELDSAKRAFEESAVSNDTRTRKKIAIEKTKKDNMKYLFGMNPWLETLKIRPTGVDRVYHEFVFGENGNLFDISDKQIPTKTVGAFYRDRINWEKTLENMLDILKENVQKNRLNDYQKDNAIKSYNALSMENIRVGKGLRGAGITRGTIMPFNLRDIKGTGTASDMKYKAIGSKFIRVGDLDKGKLKLVYPNRTSVGRFRDISPQVCEMLKEVVYDGNVNQQAYNALDIDDKQLFHEIISVCHLKYETKNPLKEPKEHLKVEFDKLKGMIQIGNDKPAIVKELKALAVDLFDFKKNSKAELKKIASL